MVFELGPALAQRLALSAVLFAAVASAAPIPEPDEATKAAARQLAQDGARALEERRYAEAQDLLDRAYQLYRAPTIAVLEGRALEQLGRLVEAAEHYERARRTTLTPADAEAFREAVGEAEALVRALRARIPQLTIEIQGLPADHPDLEVQLDGARVLPPLIGVRRPIDPGEHRVVARVGSGAPVERVIRIAERRQERVVLAPPIPPGTPSTSPRVVDPERENDDDGGTQRTWAYVGLGVGAVGLATGVIAGLVMLDKKSSLDDVCTPTCPASAEDDLDGFRTARTVSLIGYGVGVVGIATGAILLLTAPSRDARSDGLAASLSVGMGPGNVGVNAIGHF